MTEASRPVTVGRPRSSRVFDQAVAVGGGCTAVATVVAVVATGTPIPWAYFVAVPLVALIARFPISVSRGRGALTIGLEPCVLAYLVVVLPPLAALAVWGSAAVVAAFVATSRANRLFNSGVMLLAGAAAVALVHAVGNDAELVPRELVAAIMGCALYFVVDLLVTELSLTLESGRRDSSTPAPYVDVVVAFLGFLGVCSLGYLMSLVDRALPPWTMALLVVPVLTLLVASNGVSRQRETARRMRVLLETSSAVQSAVLPAQVLSTIDGQTQLLMQSTEAGLRDEPPGPDQIGTRIWDGERLWWLVADKLRIRGATAPLSDSNALTMIGSFAEEGLARLALTRALRLQAERDALTDLPNRNVFVVAVEDALESVRNSGGQVAVLFCDLDGFKTVNDWFGHPAGDELLVDVARRLCHAVGRDAVVARLGGDEFAILVEGMDDEQVRTCAQRVLRAVQQRFEYSGRYVNITTSVGAATSRGDHTSDHLVRNADIAMYEAKRLGKDRFSLYHPSLGRTRVRALELTETLRVAITDRELRLVYQPVVDLATGKIVGVEALARWSPRGREMPPDEFIRLAEGAGLINLLGDAVLTMVAQDSAALLDSGISSLTVSVNVSAHQLRSSDFAATVSRVNRALGTLDLVLEITERHLVGDDEEVRSVLAALERSGVRLALDDFGIGFSSIASLRQLAVHVLKTDRVFSADIDREPRAMSLLSSMIDMGRALGLSIVIEGIERESQRTNLLRNLSSLDNVSLQGHLLARPAPLADVILAIRSQQAQLHAAPS